MINAVSKVQKIASGASSGVVINASLPVSIKVAEKSGFNRYTLKFGNRLLSTKSQRELKVGGEYWGEIASGKDNIVIQNLYEKPDIARFDALDEGLNLIEKLINEPNLEWFYDYIFMNLAAANDKPSFEIYKNMLLALQKNIIHVPFFYGENLGVFQFKKGAKQSEIYLIFSNFAPIKFKLINGQIAHITTPFNKVARFLADEFGCEVSVGQVSEIYGANSAIIDFKG